MNAYYPKLFEPFTVKGHRFRNRIFSAPNMMCYMDANGFPTPDMISYYGEKARGGAAVVTVGDTPVDDEHAASLPRSFNLSFASLPFLSELAMAIHEGGALASLELNHAGYMAKREANRHASPDWQPWGPVDMVREQDGQQVHGMTEEEIRTVVRHFADAAELVKDAGFDMCLIHGGHGWLLDQFLSPLYNHRTDQFGGSLENRARLALMVIDAIRERCGDRFLIELRMSGAEEIEGGLTKEESVAFAKLVDGKVDFIHVSAGMDTKPAQAVRTHPTIFLPHGVNVHYAQAVKEAGVKTPVVTVGAISTPEMAEEILESGKADVVAMVRALIADPHLPNKAKAGKAEDIRPCMRCLDCLTGMQTKQHFQCSANPQTGRELRYRNFVQPAAVSRKVLVVGGGPGGMMAAATAGERGHDVVLAEKANQLGGLLQFTQYDELKGDLNKLMNWLMTKVQTSGAKIRLGLEVTPEYVRENQFDAVIYAGGSVPAKPKIPGLDLPSVNHATEIYTADHKLGQRVAILGGGLVGCETAVYLAQQGHDVVIVEMQDEIAPEANWMHREGMMQAFAQLPITCKTGLRVTEITENGVSAVDKDGSTLSIAADEVVYAFGMKSNCELLEQLEAVHSEIIPVGDAVRPRRVREAIMEAYWAAVRLG